MRIHTIRAAALALAAGGLATLLGAASPVLAAGVKPVRKAAPARAARPPMSQLGQLAKVAPVPVGMQRPTREILLSIGEGELITLPVGADSVWVSNPIAADVYVNSARQLHLFGKGNGDTTVFASRANGDVIFAAQVHVNQNVTALDRILRTALPDAHVKVTMVGSPALLPRPRTAPPPHSWSRSR